MGSSLVLNRRPKVPAEDTAAFGAIAERFRRGGALEQAVSLCRDGLKKFPDHVSARVTLGWALLDLGKYEEARIELEQVMRRAPDNLAAIRGLAELHDRFEHTLNLPMDGPGEWPPPAESLEDAAPAGDGLMTFQSNTSADFHADADDSIVATAATMVPAEMGLPLWTPAPEAAVAEAAEDVVANAQIQVHAPSSGMSSVREIDAFAGAPIPVQSSVESVVEEPVALSSAEIEPVVEVAAAQPAVEEVGVSDDAIAALIAEADTLDAVADLDAVAAADAPVVAEPVEVAAAVDFAGAVDVDLVSPLELGSTEAVETAAVASEATDIAGEPIELASEVIEFSETGSVGFADTESADLQTSPVVFEPAVFEASQPEAQPGEPEVVAVAELEAAEVPEVVAVADAVDALDTVETAEVVAVAESVLEVEAAETVEVAESVEAAEVVAAADALDVAEADTAAESLVEVLEAAETPAVATAVQFAALAAIEIEEEAVVTEPEAVAVAEVTAEVVAEVLADTAGEPEVAAAAMVETPAPVAEVIAFVRPEAEELEAAAVVDAISPARRKKDATIFALERMLKRVQARRQELESVA